MNLCRFGVDPCIGRTASCSGLRPSKRSALPSCTAVRLLSGTAGLTDLTKLRLAGYHRVLCNSTFMGLVAHLHSLKIWNIFDAQKLVHLSHLSMFSQSHFHNALPALALGCLLLCVCLHEHRSCSIFSACSFALCFGCRKSYLDTSHQYQEHKGVCSCRL